MEASYFLPYDYSQLLEASSPAEQAGTTRDDINVLDAIHQGYQARRVIVNGADLGLAFTCEQVDPRDKEWTYYLHYDDLEDGKCFGEIDVHLDESFFSIYGGDTRPDITAENIERAEKMMVGAALLLPLVIQKDFPKITVFQDVMGDD